MEWLLVALSLQGNTIQLCPPDKRAECMYVSLIDCLKKAEQFNHAAGLAGGKIDLECRETKVGKF